MTTAPLSIRRGLAMIAAAQILGLVCYIAAAAALYATGQRSPSVIRWIVIDPLIGLTAAALLWIPLIHSTARRGHITACLIVGLTAISAWALGAALFTLAHIARHQSRRNTSILIAVWIVACVASVGLYPNQHRTWAFVLPAGIGYAALIGAVPVLVGLYLRTRDRLDHSLEAQIAAAHAEQRARIAQARAEERNRIARDMHDTLAHQLSLITLHTGALDYNPDLTPAEQIHALTTINNAARAANTELRTILGLLRGTSDALSGEESGHPHTLAALPALIDAYRGSGAIISVTTRPESLTVIPDGVSRQLYRITQEALTNSTKHAPRQPITISVIAHPPQPILLTIANPLVAGSQPGPGSRLGLIGIRERATMLGGTITVRKNDYYALTVQIPWPA